MIEKNTSRSRAALVGLLILVAYGVVVGFLTQSKIIVPLADVISGLAVIGIAVLMAPLFRDTAATETRGYLALKALEGGLMVVGGVLFLSDSLQQYRSWIYDEIHVYAFVAGGFFFYHLLYKTRIVPRFVAVWGAIATVSMTITALLGELGIRYPLLDAQMILIVSNEVFLAIWLIAKGFNEPTAKKER